MEVLQVGMCIDEMGIYFSAVARGRDVAWGSEVRCVVIYPNIIYFVVYAVEQKNVSLKSISIISNMAASLATCSSEWLT
jgi:hypothetical protein